jgi:hypothetical protein
MDDDLGETTSQDTERSQDRTKCVDLHEVDLSLRRGARDVMTCHGRNVEVAVLRTYSHGGGQTKYLDEGSNSVHDTQCQRGVLEARHLIYGRDEPRL